MLTYAASFLLFISIVTGAVLQPGGSSNAKPFRICYYYFGTVQDLGWTLSFNDARISAHEPLAELLSNVSNGTLQLESYYRSNVFFDVPDFEEQVRVDVTVTACAIFVANNRLLFGDEVAVAKRYPNISFFVLNDELALDHSVPNLAYFGERTDGGYFVAGSLAAAMSPRCVGFLVAYHMYRNPYDAANGFAAGVRWVNASIPIIVVEIGSWSNPLLEAALTTALINDRGCEVIAHYSDTHTVDATVARWSRNVTVPRAFSVGAHADIRRFEGESVLISVTTNWTGLLLAMLSPLLHNATQQGPLYRPRIPRDSVYLVPSLTSDVSTATSGLQSVATQASDALVAWNATVSFGANGVPLPAVAKPCGEAERLYPFRSIFCASSLELADGSQVTVNQSAGSCVCGAQFLRHIIQLDKLSYYSGIADPTSCGTGQSAVVSPLFQLECHPCSAGTYQDTPGLSGCIPCPAGTVSDAGAQVCSLPHGTFPIVALIVPLVVVTAVAVVLGLYQIRKVAGHGAQHAPTAVPFGLLVLRIHQADDIATRPSAFEAFGMFTAILHRVLDMSDGYLSETVIDEKSGEELYVIATKEPSDVVLIGLEMLRAMNDADWPREVLCTAADGTLYNGLLPCMFVQCVTGRGTVIKRRSTLSPHYVYSGPEVSMARDFCTRVAHPGQLLVSAPTLRQLRDFPATYHVFGEGVECPVYAKNFVLEKYAAMALFSIVPSELSKKRIFTFVHDSGTAAPQETSRSHQATAARTEVDGDAETANSDVSAPTVARVIDLTLSRYDSREAAEHLRSIASVWGVTTAMSSARLRLEVSNIIARELHEKLHRSTEQGSRTLNSSLSTRHSRGVVTQRSADNIGDPDNSFTAPPEKFEAADRDPRT